jgi:uncharacterized protein involved in exopolysaccharide biosynthesis
MEEEIDLRSYVEIVLRHWKWIAALALVAASAALVASLLLPATYEASSVIIVTEPRYQIQFDPRFETAEGGDPAYQAFPTLATSDGILLDVVKGYHPSADAGIKEWRLTELSEVVEATSGGDPSLVVLKVRSQSPQDAASIANAWADILVQKGNEIYGGNEKDVAFFEEQAALAAEALDEADANLVEFEARNQTSIVSTQLESERQAQADYLDAQRAIAYIIQDIQGLRGQLAEQSGTQPISPADDLTALLLQIKAFNAETSAPIELRFDTSGSVSSKSQAEQVAFLDDLVATLQAKSAEIDARLLELEPRILELQQRFQEMNVEYDRLVRAQELVRETYLTLARKLDEARIAVREENGMLRVGSYAAVPEKASGPRTLLNATVAGTLGLIIGVLAALAIESWRRNEKETPDGGE